MKVSGIIRRIDDLGRIVIPKEIRRVLHIHEGDPLEISTSDDGEILLKKYSPVGTLPNDLAQNCVDVLQEQLGFISCICDRDVVLYVSKGSRHNFLKKQPISEKMGDFLDKREPELVIGDCLPITHRDDIELYRGQIIYPIKADNNIYGLLILIQGVNSSRDIRHEDMAMVQGVAKILERMIEL